MAAVLGSAKAPPEELLLLEATLENYTPVMIGDYDANTWRRLNQREQAPARPLFAQGLLGRMRWLLRLLSASLPNSSRNSYVDLENYQISGQGLRELKLSLTRALMGYLAQRGPSMSAPFTLQADLDVSSAGLWRNAAWVLQSAQGRARPQRRGLDDRFNALLSRGRTAERYLLAPIGPGGLKVTLRVLKQPRADVLFGPRSSAFSALYVALALTVPTIFGLGKGVNRGFGRFKVTRYRVNKELLASSPQLGGLIRDLQDLNLIVGGPGGAGEVSSEKAGERLRDIFRKLIELAAAAAGVPSPSWQQVSSVPSRVPSAMDFIALRLPFCGGPQQVVLGASVVGVRLGPNDDPIDRAIEAIAEATLKVTWKSNSRVGRATYHTWPLGLPRSSKIEGVPTGYLLGGPGQPTPRRQSMFIIFPLPLTEVSGNGRRELVALLPIVDNEVLRRLIKSGKLTFVGSRRIPVRDLLINVNEYPISPAAKAGNVQNRCPDSLCDGCKDNDRTLECRYYLAICRAYYSVAGLLEVLGVP